jgi:hypothetical protein
MLSPLEAEALDSPEKQDKIVVELCPRPCPLIRPGLDHMSIMQAQGLDQSKDAAIGLTLQRVKSRAAAIQQLQEQAKKGTSDV